MKILNIHGYNGNAHNSAYAALEALGYNENIIAPQLDYDSLKPEKVLEILHNQIVENRVDIIVGTSLGGFFAAVLSVQLNLPVFLVNPCLMPFLYLPRLGFKGDLKSFITMFGSLSKIDKNNLNCIIGGQDEIIDSHDFTKALLENEKYKIIPDGRHSGATLPLEDYFKQILGILASNTNSNP